MLRSVLTFWSASSFRAGVSVALIQDAAIARAIPSGGLSTRLYGSFASSWPFGWPAAHCYVERDCEGSMLPSVSGATPNPERAGRQMRARGCRGALRTAVSPDHAENKSEDCPNGVAPDLLAILCPSPEHNNSGVGAMWEELPIRYRNNPTRHKRTDSTCPLPRPLAAPRFNEPTESTQQSSRPQRLRAVGAGKI